MKYSEGQFSSKTFRKTEGYKQNIYSDYTFGSNIIKARSYADSFNSKIEFNCNLDDDSLCIFDFKSIIDVR